MNKITKALLTVAMAVTFMAGTSHAADTWSTCTPAQIGPYGAIVRVQLTGCSVAPQKINAGDWMTLNSVGTDQMMATILTAMSLGNVITVKTTGNTDAEGVGVVDALIMAAK